MASCTFSPSCRGSCPRSRRIELLKVLEPCRNPCTLLASLCHFPLVVSDSVLAVATCISRIVCVLPKPSSLIFFDTADLEGMGIHPSSHHHRHLSNDNSLQPKASERLLKISYFLTTCQNPQERQQFFHLFVDKMSTTGSCRGLNSMHRAPREERFSKGVSIFTLGA